MTKARRKDFELQSSELWGNESDLNIQLQFQCPIFPLKNIYIKSMFFELFGAYLEGRRRSYKGLYTCVLLQNTVHDKSHPETKILCIESVLCG